MDCYRSIAEIPPGFGPCALTIGNFDGVHLGHRRILERTIAAARGHGWRAAVLTFDPHPLQVVAPERAPRVMTGLPQRLRLLAELGLDAAIVLPFTREFSRLEPEEFVERILARRLGCRQVVVGENFRFGRRQAGDVNRLITLGLDHGFETEGLGPVEVGGETVSSSRIRRELEQGRMAVARRLLGRAPSLAGEVVAGRGIGSRSTVPTLNLDPQTKLLPADGVYVSETLEWNGDRVWRSVSNIGVRPTFGGGARTVETHLLDELNHEPPSRIEVRLYQRLREEKMFSSPEALRAQILRDIERAQRYFRLRDRLQRHMGMPPTERAPAV